VQTEEKRAKVISMFVGFRNYLHYHIKASKTYLHMRMRSRVTSLLQGQKSMLGRTHAGSLFSSPLASSPETIIIPLGLALTRILPVWTVALCVVQC
jgi:hypothetical protein